MAVKRWTGAVVGLALAGFGIATFVAPPTSTLSTPADPSPAPAPASEPVVQTVVETIPMPQPDIGGLPESTSRVLAAHGYAGIATQGELGLPDSVARVLEANGAVLLVAEGGTP